MVYRLNNSLNKQQTTHAMRPERWWVWSHHTTPDKWAPCRYVVVILTNARNASEGVLLSVKNSYNNAVVNKCFY